MVLYICVDFWLLALKSRDISQAENKVTVFKAEQIHKMLIIFIRKGRKLSFFDLLSFGNSYFFLGLRLITWFKSQEPKANTGVDDPCRSLRCYKIMY